MAPKLFILLYVYSKSYYNTVSLITGSASMDPNSIIMRLTCTGFLS